MSIVTVANESGLHVNTVSKYFKALRSAGQHIPSDHEQQVKLIADLTDEATKTGKTVYEVIKTRYDNAPAIVGKNSAVQTTATAAAIEEQLTIVSRKLEALMQKLECDTEETNEMLAEFDSRIEKANDNARLALSIARAAIDKHERKSNTDFIADALILGFNQIAKNLNVQPITIDPAADDADAEQPDIEKLSQELKAEQPDADDAK